MKEYTERLNGYQIRDVAYFGRTPENAPIEFDIVKWVECEPHEVVYYNENSSGTYDMAKRIMTEYCYSVAFLVWNPKEPCFEFRSVGMRWLEERPGDDVIDMIMKFCEEKEKELRRE